jgi:hypothetical protein
MLFSDRVNCSEAHLIEIPISYHVRKELKWPEWKRSLRYLHSKNFSSTFFSTGLQTILEVLYKRKLL